MITRIGITTLLFFFSGILVYSQSISLSVLSSYGSFQSASSGSLSSTLGEPMVETFSSSSNILTQGFQQPDDIVITALPDESSSELIKVYPNPTDDHLTIEGVGSNIDMELILTDISGREVRREYIAKDLDKNDLPHLDLKNIISGIYFLTIAEKDSGKKIRVLRIVKI